MLISFVGVFFAIIFIETQPTAVGVLAGVLAAAGSVFAIASLVAAQKHQEVERAWFAIGLLVLAFVPVIAVNAF